MGVIQLETYLFRQPVNVIMFLHIFSNRPLYAGGNKEVLLFQSQLFTGDMVVVGIEDLTDGTGKILLLHSFLVVSLVKRIQVKGINGLGIPDTKGIHDTVAVSHDGNVIGNRLSGLIILLHIAVTSALILADSYMPAKFYLGGIFRTLHLKWIAIFQPVVRRFDLETILDLLHKHTVFVANTAAISRISKSG